MSYPTDRCLGYDELLTHVTARISDEAKLILVAESFGGPLAVMYAAAHPDRIAAVVLCASFVLSPSISWLARLAHPELFRLPFHELTIQLILAGADAPQSVIDLAAHAVKRVSPEVLAHRVRETMSLDCQSLLTQFHAPILYLQAARDALVTPASLECILKTRPDTVVRRFPAYHMLLQTMPRHAWREIEAFLNTH
jgi:pimeloyl-[acyl-carrier protein] methyl ester esterase